MKQKTVFIVALVALVFLFLVGSLLYNAKPANEAPQMSDARRAALVRMHSPSLGKSDAPVVIVEFLDPACETCAAFYPMVKELMAANPNQIRVVLRYAPFHKGSDKVVAVLEAARKQGKFWQVLEALLVRQSAWAPHHTAQVDLVWPLLEGLGLDMNKLRADAGAPEIANVIAQDLEDARTLNVTKTPEFFVNGRPLPSFGFEQLKALVNTAIGETRRQ